jgi:hypothetical protein
LAWAFDGFWFALGTCANAIAGMRRGFACMRTSNNCVGVGLLALLPCAVWLVWLALHLPALHTNHGVAATNSGEEGKLGYQQRQILPLYIVLFN